jgi:hypothetical protein
MRTTPRRSRIALWVGLLVAFVVPMLVAAATPDRATVDVRPANYSDRVSASAKAIRVNAAPPTVPGSSQLFAASSPFNQLIPANPVLDPSSAAMVAYTSRQGQGFANLWEYGIPIFDADAGTPRYSIGCTMSPAWGPCPFAGLAVPIPAGAAPNAGLDGAMVVIDWSARRSYEFWQVRRSGNGWVTSWGAVNSIDGSGWGGGSTGAGASRLAGVVRVAEVAAGVIPHALVVAIDNACRPPHRAPATKSDGQSSRGDCIPEGARLQLDPSIDAATIPGITAGERAVAVALQRYGAYVIDNTGAPLSVAFEVAPDATGSANPGAVYQGAGFPWDHYDMPHIPWNRLRVLRAWTGT